MHIETRRHVYTYPPYMCMQIFVTVTAPNVNNEETHSDNSNTERNHSHNQQNWIKAAVSSFRKQVLQPLCPKVWLVYIFIHIEIV